jgi:hypothetical protein
MKFSKFLLIVPASLMAGMVPSAFGFAEVARGKLTATTQLAYQYDSNIYANSSEVSDYSVIFTPTLAYSRNVGAISTAAQLSVRSVSFQDTSGQDSIDPSLIVNFNADRAEKGQAAVSVSYARRTDANDVLNTRTKSDEYNGSAKVDYYFSEKTGFRFNAGYRVSDYLTTGYNNVSSYNVGGGLVYKYSPKLTGVATYSYSPEKATDLGASPTSNPSSTNQRFQVGFEGELAPKLTGNVSTGWVYRKFDRGGDDNALLLAAALSWTATAKTNVTLSASNDFDTTPAAESAKNFSTGLTVRQSITAKLNVGATYSYQHSQLDKEPGPGTRTDKANIFSGDVTYRFTDSFNMSASISRRLSNSTLALADYARNTASLSATYTF